MGLSHYAIDVTYPRYLFHDTSNHAGPRLALAQSYWALQERATSIEDALAHAYANGFEYLEAGLREERMASLRAILQTHPLKLIAQGWASTVQEAIPFFERAIELNAVVMNLHLGDAYLHDVESERLVDEAYALAESYKLPLMLETHRGRVTQDLYKMSALMRRRLDTRIVLDVSHYLVAGENFGGDATKFSVSLGPLLNATEMIHGRISNGQQIQVSAADTESVALTQSIWENTMAIWLANAPRDAVFVFEPELGPPPYAYLAHRVETYSRTEETDSLVRLAREAWDRAVKRVAA
jgi:hypothetical protein